MAWFDYGLNFISLAIQAVFHALFSSRFSGKKAGAMSLTVYFLSLCAIQIAAPTIAVLLALLALYCVNRVFLKNSHSVSGITAILAVYITQLSFGLINSLETLLFPAIIDYSLLTNTLIVLATGLALLICRFCYQHIVKQFAIDGSSPYAWILLPSCLFFFVTEFYIAQTAYQQAALGAYNIELGKHLALLALQILGFAALFSTLFAYQHICDGFRAKSALEQLKQAAHAQETYVAQAQTRYEQTRAFRHDLKNHLSVLSGLIKNGNWEQAQTYLEKLDYTTQELSFPIQTGNPIIDILLGDKMELARKLEIDWEISISLPRDELDDLDLCVIFSNAIDNAITACQRVVQDRKIRVSDQRQGDFYMLEFENTCTDGPQQPMGIGLSNIKAAAEKNGGTIIIEKSPSFYRLSILLNISLQSQDIPGQTD